MTIQEKNILFIGNPGVGKSALLNCLCGQARFKSGLNIGSGISYKLDQFKFNGVTYMDTPGLKDVAMRETAAKAITEAVKKGGVYLVAFIVTLEAGRVKPEDAATIKTILENVPEIDQFGIVINKLTNRVFTDISNDATVKNKITSELTGLKNMNLNFLLLIQKIDDLDDGENIVIDLPILKSFVFNKLPSVSIHSQNAKEIPSAEYDIKYKREMEIQKQKIEEERKKQERIRKEAEEARQRREQELREEQRREREYQQKKEEEKRRRMEEERVKREREIKEAADRRNRQAEREHLERQRVQREQERLRNELLEQQRRQQIEIERQRRQMDDDDACVIL